jgi:hypothetical protein
MKKILSVIFAKEIRELAQASAAKEIAALKADIEALRSAAQMRAVAAESRRFVNTWEDGGDVQYVESDGGWV